MKKIIIPAILISLIVMIALVSGSPNYKSSYDADTNELTLPVYIGWNFIALESNNARPDTSDIKQEDFKYTYVYDFLNEEYVLLYYGGKEVDEIENPVGQWKELKDRATNFIDTVGTEDLEDYYEKSSAWVYFERDGTITYRIDPSEQVQLFKGWNFATVSPEMANVEGIPVSEQFEIKDIVGTCDIEESYMFDPEDKKWVDFPLSEEFYDYMIGMGWVLKVADDCSLDTSKESVLLPPAAPSMPGDEVIISNCVMINTHLPCSDFVISTDQIQVILSNQLSFDLKDVSATISGCDDEEKIDLFAQGSQKTLTFDCAVGETGETFDGDIEVEYTSASTELSYKTNGKLVGTIE